MLLFFNVNIFSRDQIDFVYDENGGKNYRKLFVSVRSIL